MKLRPWQLSLIAVSLCALTLAGVLRYRGQAVRGHEWMFRRLPTDHAIMVGIDVEALREAGLLEVLAGPRATEELDYRRFVDQTGFDYRSDLDYVAASIALNNSARHFVLKGRFNWDALFKTATRAGGRCQNTFCDMPGFTAGKDMSFLPLGPDALGLSSTAAQQAAWALTAEYTGVPMPSVRPTRSFSPWMRRYSRRAALCPPCSGHLPMCFRRPITSYLDYWPARMEISSSRSTPIACLRQAPRVSVTQFLA